jgi:hypothetical protein
VSRAFGSDDTYVWESDGAEGYTITKADEPRATHGTDVILTLRDEPEAPADGEEADAGFDKYLSEWGLRDLVKHYSNYVRHPIRMMVTKSRQLPKPDDADDDYVPEYEDDYEAEREKSTQRGVVQTQEQPEPMSAEQIAFLNQINESRLMMGKSRKPGNREANLLRKREQADYELEMTRDYTYLEKQPLDKELNTFYKLWCRKDGSENLNGYLLKKNLGLNAGDHPRFDEREKAMNEYIRSNPLKRNMTLWRSMSLDTDNFEKYRKRKRILNPGIVSFSKSMQHSASYYNPNPPKGMVPFLIKLNAKKGDAIAPPYQIRNGKMVGYPEECEFDAPSMSKLRIIKERKFGEVVIFECELEA